MYCAEKGGIFILYGNLKYGHVKNKYLHTVQLISGSAYITRPNKVESQTEAHTENYRHNRYATSVICNNSLNFSVPIVRVSMTIDGT